MKSSIVLVVLLLFAISTQARWKKTSDLNPGSDQNYHVLSLTSNDGTVYACTDKGIFSTSDNGANWKEINNGLTNLNVNVLVFTGSSLIAGTDGGVFLSSDAGANWSPVLTKEGTRTLRTNALVVKDGNVFAGTHDGIYISNDNGANWEEAFRGFNSSVKALTASKTDLYAGTDDGVFLSTDNGTTWGIVSGGNSELTYVLTLIADGDSIFAGTYGNGIFISTNKGSSWEQMNNGLSKKYIRAIVIKGKNVFATSYGGGTGGIFVSTDYGANWTDITKGQGLSIYKIPSVCISGENIFIGNRYGQVHTRPLSELITTSSSEIEFMQNGFSLSQNFPNPFITSTTINYNIGYSEVAKHVTLKVYNILGNEIQTLVNDKKEPGYYNASFNGNLFPNGIYYYKLSSGNYSVTKRMVLNK